MAQKIRGVTVEIGGDTTGLQKSLKEVNSAISATAKQLKDVNNLLKLDPSNTELLKQKQTLLANEISEVKKKIEEEKAALAQMNEESGTEAATEGQMALQRDIIASEQKLQELERQARESASVLGTQFQLAGEKISATGDKISDAGQKLLPVTGAIIGVGAASVAAATDFEDAMAKLSTIADTSEETGISMDDLETQIMELSDATGIASSEIAENVYNAISAGQETGDAVNFVAQSTKLATAGFADSGQALDLLTTILNAYGMEAEEVNHVSDVLINTQNLGKTTVGELASAMGKVIPTANAANVSLENLAAGYSIMTANGIATAESTTYMNSMLNELSKSGTTASDTIKEKTGKSFQELMADGSSLADVLTILQQAAEKDNVAMGDMFGSAEAGKAALVLLSGGAEEFNNTVQSMTDSTGATDEAFAKLDTTSRQANIAINQVKNAAIELGSTILEMLAPYIEMVTEKIKEVTDWFKNLDDDQQQLAVTIAAIVAALGPVIIIVGKVVSFIGTIISSIGTIITVLTTVGTFIVGTLIPAIGAIVVALGPVILVIGAFVTAVLGVVAIIKNWGAISEWLSEKWAIAKEMLAEAWESMKQKVVETFNNIKESITTTITNLVTSMKKWASDMIQGFVSNITQKIASIKEAIAKIKEAIAQTFKNIINSAKQWGIDMIQQFIDGIKAMIGKIGDAVTGVANKIKSILGFSLPETGPLSKANTWMPDMIQLLADTMENSIGLLDPALNATASRISELSNINVDANNADLINYLGGVLPGLGNQQIVLDTGALVGQTVGQYNAALGKLYTYDQRSV